MRSGLPLRARTRTWREMSASTCLPARGYFNRKVPRRSKTLWKTTLLAYPVRGMLLTFRKARTAREVPGP